MTLRSAAGDSAADLRSLLSTVRDRTRAQEVAFDSRNWKLVGESSHPRRKRCANIRGPLRNQRSQQPRRKRFLRRAPKISPFRTAVEPQTMRSLESQGRIQPSRVVSSETRKQVRGWILRSASQKNNCHENTRRAKKKSKNSRSSPRSRLTSPKPKLRGDAAQARGAHGAGGRPHGS